MGSETHTVRDIQIVRILETTGEIKKRLLLDVGKEIAVPNGMSKTLSMQIIQLKSLYNEGFLKAFGYNPNSNTYITKLDKDTILSYTQQEINPNATTINNLSFGSLNIEIQSIIHLQEYPDWKATERSFTYNGDKYHYLTCVQNGTYIDITIYKNRDSTVTAYLDNKYGQDNWTIIDQSETVNNINGQLVWKVTVEYTHIVNGVIQTNTAEEYIDIEVEYLQITDEEYSFMEQLANNYTGQFSSNYCYETYNGTECLYVTIDRTVTYLGNGEFDISVTSSTIPQNFQEQQIINSAITDAKQSAHMSIKQVITNNIRKIIWSYHDGDIDNSKITYALAKEHPDFFVKVQASSMPFIPLKRNRSIVNPDNQKIILKKIGMDSDAFKSSLSAGEMIDAYLMFGVPCTATNKAAIIYIFELLASLSDVVSVTKFGQQKVYKSIELSFDAISLDHKYDVEIEVVYDSSHTKGSYWHDTEVRQYTDTKTDSDGNTYTYTYNVTHNAYCKQEDDDYYIKIVVLGVNATYILGGILKTFGCDNEMRYPIIKDIYVKLPLGEYADLLEQSMALIFNTETTYETSWFQSSFFRIVTIVVSIVVAVVTFGSSTFANLSLFGKIIVGAGVTAGVLSAMGLDLGYIGLAIGVMSAIYAAHLAIDELLNSEITFDLVVKGVDKILKVPAMIHDIIQKHNMENMMKEAMDELAKSNEELEKLKEEYNNMTKNTIKGGLWMSGADIPVDTYYDIATGNFDQYQLMYEQPYNYDFYFNLNQRI